MRSHESGGSLRLAVVFNRLLWWYMHSCNWQGDLTAKTFVFLGAMVVYIISHVSDCIIGLSDKDR